jgi:hypothetical protein
MSESPFFYIIIFIGVWTLVFQMISGKFDRKRIREHIESHGGEVINIERNSFGAGLFGGSSDRTYDVRYRTKGGKRATASCKTGMMNGVYWISRKPPGEMNEPSEDFGLPDEVVDEIPQSPAESIDCLECGTKIEAGKTRCPQCAWSYKEALHRG